MIRNRDSDAYLHTETILLKISEYDIFKYNCAPFVDLDRRFCSAFREDTSNDSVISCYKGRLLYKDFGLPAHSFNCFTYVMNNYGVTFQEALQIIDRDFGLNLGPKKIFSDTRGPKPTLYNKVIKEKRLVIIKKKKREWNKEDATFWKQFNISKKILELFNVEPISYFWINDARFTCFTPTYAYKIGQKYKIYAPYEKEKKWFSNTCSTQIQGEHILKLGTSRDYLIITSSLKDAMCLYSFNIPAIAFQSELTMPDENTMDKLKNCYKDIIIFYDNDFTKEGNPGQTMAKKICDKYKLDNIYIPMQYSSKDISDFIKNGYKHLIGHIKNYINDAKKKT